ncbi:M48 family metalloprotease [Pseudomonas aeruginosa]|uniref:M48 family metalloprotease n=1 Tax=Pseudomonas aeruginosa TaxID=287 RepID=UPI003F995A4E
MKSTGRNPFQVFRDQWAIMSLYERFEQVVALVLSAVIAVIIVVSLFQLIAIVFTLLVLDAFNPLDHKVFQSVFGMIMTLLIAMEFKHSIVRVALRRDSIIQVKTVILIGLIALARKFVILDPEASPAKIAASALSLRLYRVRALHPQEAHEMWALLRELPARAGLPATPVPHYVPSAVVNAFATGSKQEASIALTDGLLRSLSPRELAGVLAHEIAHITNEDLRVMRLADSVSRLTSLLALMGQIAILLNLPALLVGAAEVYWPGLLLLAASPRLALLAQLGLSRVREFDADRLAAELTGDPQGLASALAKIERVSRSWRAWLWPGWGNPEPSCLRTHPATQERIARLLTLAPGPASALPFHAPHFLPESAVTPRPPRWHPSGLWR